MKTHTHRYTSSVSQLREPIKFKILYLTIEKFKLIHDEKKTDNIQIDQESILLLLCGKHKSHTPTQIDFKIHSFTATKNTHKQNAYMMK